MSAVTYEVAGRIGRGLAGSADYGSYTITG
jgi:hypothetical protein